MGVVEKMRGALRGWSAGEELSAAAGARKTAIPGAGLPSVLTPWRPAGSAAALPKPTPETLRRFAETPIARRAINVVKDRIGCMDWDVRPKRDAVVDDTLRARVCALRHAFEQPNPQDSFRCILEQVLEDVIVGGFGAVEVEPTGDPVMPVRLWPVDGGTVQINAKWKGDDSEPRYLQYAPGASGTAGVRGVPLLDRELMYVRLNPRSHTPFGLGRLEVAFESVNNFLRATRHAAKLADNSVVQYALWIDGNTPQQQERLIRWWQDEVEGTGQVPILSTANKPEVLRLSGGTDADLRLGWQEFLLRVIANAFDLPPMLLGVQGDVNRSTADEMAEQAFQNAIVPVARLLEQHLTRDVIAKALGWDDVEFVFSDLLSRDPATEVSMQLELLKAGVLTVAEVRSQRGLAPFPAAPTDNVRDENEAGQDLE